LERIKFPIANCRSSFLRQRASGFGQETETSIFGRNNLTFLSNFSFFLPAELDRLYSWQAAIMPFPFCGYSRISHLPGGMMPNYLSDTTRFGQNSPVLRPPGLPLSPFEVQIGQNLSPIQLLCLHE